MTVRRFQRSASTPASGERNTKGAANATCVNAINETEWVNVEAWGRLGEVAQQYLKKGSLVYLEGRLKTDKYEDKGETKYYTKVVALLMQFLDKKPADEPVMTVDEQQAEYEA